MVLFDGGGRGTDALRQKSLLVYCEGASVLTDFGMCWALPTTLLLDYFFGLGLLLVLTLRVLLTTFAVGSGTLSSPNVFFANATNLCMIGDS